MSFPNEVDKSELEDGQVILTCPNDRAAASKSGREYDGDRRERSRSRTRDNDRERRHGRESSRSRSRSREDRHSRHHNNENRPDVAGPRDHRGRGRDDRDQHQYHHRHEQQHNREREREQSDYEYRHHDQRREHPAVDKISIHVSGLDCGMTIQQLKCGLLDMLAPHMRQQAQVYIVAARRGGQPRGFCFVHVFCHDDARRVFELLHMRNMGRGRLFCEMSRDNAPPPPHHYYPPPPPMPYRY